MSNEIFRDPMTGVADYVVAEQEMQELEQVLWGRCQAEDIDPRNQEEEEEFGTPNAAYCQSIEPDHNGGWFCYHPDCVTSHDEGLCEGCHRKEEICICGGIPEGF